MRKDYCKSRTLSKGRLHQRSYNLKIIQANLVKLKNLAKTSYKKVSYVKAR